MKNNLAGLLAAFTALVVTLYGCLPASSPYPNLPPDDVVVQGQVLSDSLASYIYKWTQGQVSADIPDNLIPDGIYDCKNFYLKNPVAVTAAETWAVRYAKPINKDSLYAGIPDPKITYLLLGTALAPFGSKLVIEGEFPHCRFFSIQVTPPLNGKEYYAQRQFGTAEVAIVDADIEPQPGSVNPFRVGANRNATNRQYKMTFDLTTGDPTTLNGTAHIYPYRSNSNVRKAGLLVYQGPLGFKTIVGTALPVEQQGAWDLGNVWIRIYEPDANVNALGGVPMPKVYFELPGGQKYFIGSDFSTLKTRADATIANRLVTTQPNPNIGPSVGWFKSWGITRSILNGVCITNNWKDSVARVRAIDLGWTGRGEFQPAPGNIEPHATTNNYISYVGRSITVPPGMVAVLTGKLPVFPSTRNGEAMMGGGDIRYWSVCGIDQDPFSPLPATTVHAISDDDLTLDGHRNYVIAYSRPADRPVNATAANGVSWVDWGTQSELGVLMRWLCVAPDWRFSLAPHEHNLDFAHSDYSSTLYDNTLLGINWRNGFMQCFLPKIHFLRKAEFESIGASVTAENVPVWVDSSYTKAGAAQSQLGTVSTSNVVDAAAVNAAANLIDGDMTSAWSSAFGQPLASATIDLGSTRQISAIKLSWDWIFFARDYTLQVSDDNVNFTTIATVVNENGVIDLYKNLQQTSGRYVKLALSNFNAGYYRLLEFEVYTNDCNCTAPATSTAESPERPAWQLYPNPAVDVLHIKTALVGMYSIQVYNMQGTSVLESTAASEPVALNIAGLPKGVYVVVIAQRNKRTAKKFIKM